MGQGVLLSSGSNDPGKRVGKESQDGKAKNNYNEWGGELLVSCGTGGAFPYYEDLRMLVVKNNMVYLWLDDASVTGDVVGRIGRKQLSDVGRNMFPSFV